MKLLLNPLIISLLFAIFTVISLILIFSIVKGRLKPNLLNLEKNFTFALITLLLIGNAQSYIGNFSLQYLGNHAENRNVHLYVTVQFMAYVLMIFLARSRVNYLFKGILFLLRDPFLFGLLMLTVLSSFWSQAPLDTFKASLVLIGLVVYSSIIAVRCNFQELAKYLREFGAWITMSSVALQVLMPSLLKNDKGGWQGIAGHPNVLGYVMALTTIVWGLNAIDRPNQRLFSIGMAVLAATVMVLTNSGGTIVTFALLACLSILFRMLTRLNLRQTTASILSLLVIAIPSALLLLKYKNMLLAIIGKDENLTGRGEFWPSIIEAIERHPVFGYGYNGFWQSWRGIENPAAHIRTINFIPTHSHNGFLELALAVGLVGVALFALSFIKNIIYITILMYSGRQPAAELSLLLSAFLIYSNLSEPGLWEIGYQIVIYTILSVRLGLEVSKGNFNNNTPNYSITS